MLLTLTRILFGALSRDPSYKQPKPRGKGWELIGHIDVPETQSDVDRVPYWLMRKALRKRFSSSPYRVSVPESGPVKITPYLTGELIYRPGESDIWRDLFKSRRHEYLFLSAERYYDPDRGDGWCFSFPVNIYRRRRRGRGG